MSTPRSRDLREIWKGKLQVEIEGVGSFGTNFGALSLAERVGTAQACLTGLPVFGSHSAQEAWEVVSFDRRGRKLKVKPVK